MYERPFVQSVTECAEGIFMASGSTADEGDAACQYGRKEFNPGSDTCQCCSATGGKYADESKIDPVEAQIMGYRTDANGVVQSFRQEDAKECPENKPRKE